MNKKLQERWVKGERHLELRQVLDLPIIKDALAIIEEEAKPNAVANMTAVGGRTAADGAFILAQICQQQAGMQLAVNRLRALAEAPSLPQTPQAPEAFDYINEKNFEEHLK